MRQRLAGSLGAKLLAGQLLVVLAGALTLLLVALLLGPGIFRAHIRDALGYVPPDVGRHLDMAFHTATLISLTIAVGASVASALLLSTVVSARVVRPVRNLADAAQSVAHGTRTARVPARGTDELARLAEAFNEMAASLDRAEEIRHQLLADVAHELRSPLATVESYVEALADGVLTADEENWRAIRSATARLNRLVDDLQRVSRAEAHQLDLDQAPTALAELVRAAITAARPAYAAKDVALDTDIQPGLPTLNVDSERLAEVLANLLSNALRHTPPRSTVNVAARRHNDLIEIAVVDTGEGIAHEHLDRIFERFYRADPARARASGGTGIGLAIARAIVEAHGGTVTATSKGPGHGTTLTIQIPIHKRYAGGEAP